MTASEVPVSPGSSTISGVNVELVDTWTWYEVAPDDAFQLSVGVKVLTVVPGCEAPPGDRPVGTGGAEPQIFAGTDTLMVLESVAPVALVARTK